MFKSPTCGPCRKAGPIVADIAGDLGLILSVLDVSVDPEAARDRNVTAVPTIILEKDAEEVYRMVGVPNRVEFENVVKEFAK